MGLLLHGAKVDPWAVLAVPVICRPAVTFAPTVQVESAVAANSLSVSLMEQATVYVPVAPGMRTRRLRIRSVKLKREPTRHGHEISKG